MVFGVNVFGQYEPPPGSFDVWIPVRTLAETTGVPESEIKRRLQENHPVLDCQVVDCWLRLRERSQAERLVAQLKEWVTKSESVHA